MNDDHKTSIETRIAHLEHTVDELSDVIARQDTEMRLLTRKLQVLMEREAEREMSGASGVTVGNEKPPHW